MHAALSRQATAFVTALAVATCCVTALAQNSEGGGQQDQSNPPQVHVRAQFLQQVLQRGAQRRNVRTAKAPTREVADAPMAALVGIRVSGPHQHKNLTIYLVSGANRPEAGTYITLDEALEQKKVIVHETGNVNSLAIENISDLTVFIQAGDVVKGGRQDRALGFDLILKPKSGKMPIAAFCVEQGRWRRRGTESAAQFVASLSNANFKDLKLGLRSGKSQSAVWASVAKSQADLSRNANQSVRSVQSASSLQLTLEDKDLNKRVNEYVKALKPLVKAKSDVIGYVFAVNGKLVSGDLYASNALFARLWPKMLRASAQEAFSELDKDKKAASPDPAAVRTFLDAPTRGKAKLTDVGDKLEEIERRYDKNVVFETRDKAAPSSWVRRSYVVDDD